jgi:DNA invertase Pin-like site-specific DNA recombinase
MMSTSTKRDQKITAQHLARRAMVYVRQSSQRQVKQNHESREMQYALAARARALGFIDVEVIDDDLGKSAGAFSAERHGFERLLASVARGEVGIIFSREVSRLSRSDKDWCRLLELCQLFDTLIADADQVYDLGSLDDQLVLGIKGTLSVVELKVLKQRMLAGMANKAARGELYRTIAPGYVVDVDGRLVKDPNLRVQEAIALVFSKFRETGSIRQTFRWFRDNDVELPVNRRRGGRASIAFQPPTHSFVADVLHNPIYAGAYVYGARPVEVRVVNGVPRKRQGAVLPPEEAKVFIRDHHEGYTDWATYEENRRRMRNNTYAWGNDEAVGAARSGQGLLVGLLRCRRCGRKLHVRYWGKGGVASGYMCVGDYDAGGSYCLRFSARPVDSRFTEELLRAISPLGVEASLLAVERLEGVGREKRAALSAKLKQAKYEATRAQEQFDEVDARNRLVASELERRWNERLHIVSEIEDALAAVEEEQRALTDEERVSIHELGKSFFSVWHDERCPPEIKKRIIRTVVTEVIADEEPSGTLRFIIHWRGGVHTTFEMKRPVSASQRKTDAEDLDIIRRMAARYGDDEIARVLNKLGRRTSTGKRWSESRVCATRKREGVVGHRRRPDDHDVMTLNGAARHTGVSDTTIRRLVEARVLRVEQIAPFAPWEIRRADLEAEPVCSILKHLRATGKLVLDGGTFGAQTSLFDEKSTTYSGAAS